MEISSINYSIKVILKIKICKIWLILHSCKILNSEKHSWNSVWANFKSHSISNTINHNLQSYSVLCWQCPSFQMASILNLGCQPYPKLITSKRNQPSWRQLTYNLKLMHTMKNKVPSAESKNCSERKSQLYGTSLNVCNKSKTTTMSLSCKCRGYGRMNHCSRPSLKSQK
jgi:hypothetical protein